MKQRAMPDHVSTDSFSNDYETARSRFRDAARKAGARLASVQVSARGPQGEQLTLDLAYLGADRPRRIMLHSSGVHGVEGFVGSAIQLGLLQNPPEYLPGDGQLLIHGVNPFGMAWLRRFNESNVDLNRNFLAPGEPYRGVSETYRRLDSFLNPKCPPAAIDPFLPVAIARVARYGMANLRQAIAEGQYEYPQGLFFGGEELEESLRRLREALHDYLQPAEKIGLIDVHSGLGKYAEQILFISPESVATLQRIGDAEWARQLVSNATGSTFYEVKGSFMNGLEREISGPEWFSVCQEFGTYSPISMLKALRRENRWHHWGGDAANMAHPIKRRLKELFCPDDPVWRQKILHAGHELYTDLATHLFKK